MKSTGLRHELRKEVIDHIVLLGPAAEAANDGRAFVLCPDGSFDHRYVTYGWQARK